jgi:hypothetical protein
MCGRWMYNAKKPKTIIQHPPVVLNELKKRKGWA